MIVTGGCGFIGSHLTEFLITKGFKVYIIDNLFSGKKENIIRSKNIILIKENILNKEKILATLKNKKIFAIFHLAAMADIVPSIINPEKYIETNVMGTTKILELAREKKIKKFIYIASSSCYGIPKNYPTKESSEIKCEYPYALSKNLGEQITMHWNKIYNLNCNSIRLFNVYGPRSRTSGAYGAVFGVFLAQILKKFPLTVVGDGRQSRDFTYVTDVISGIFKVFQKGRSGEIYNLGTGKGIRINKIISLLRYNKRTQLPVRPGEPPKTLASIVKIKKDVKWHPKTDIEEGIKNLLKNINYWKNAPLWTKKKIKSATKAWFKYLKK
ncbi:MAG: NAD-dependent epimerase/dehydratase family protein [Pelagibacteraceae bacterium]|nr:NAD-dependent epimerase/dehydratase family protein [Pelagibacteraceae bacterium]